MNEMENRPQPQTSASMKDIADKINMNEDNQLFGYLEINGQHGDFFYYDHIPRMVDDGGGLTICQNGEMEIMVDGKRYVLRSGDMCVVLPKTIVQIVRRSKDFQCLVLWVEQQLFTEVDIPSVSKVYLYVRENPCISLSEEEYQILSLYIEYLRMSYARKEHLYRLELSKKLLMALVYEIAAIYQKGNPIEKESRTRKDLIFHEFMALLTTNYIEQRRVEFYAEKLCITPKYLSAIVKSVSNRSAAEWINEMMIREAVVMLTSTDLTIQQISDKLSFPNPSFFTQYFKRATGKTPKQYRHR